MPQAVATGMFASVASFSAPTTAQGPTGNLQGIFAPVAGLQSIACMNAPDRIARVSSEEMKALALIEAKRLRHILLGGYYGQLSDAAGKGWQVTIFDPDGTVTLYDLLGAEADSQQTQTRCSLQLVAI